MAHPSQVFLKISVFKKIIQFLSIIVFVSYSRNYSEKDPNLNFIHHISFTKPFLIISLLTKDNSSIINSTDFLKGLFAK